MYSTFFNFKVPCDCSISVKLNYNIAVYTGTLEGAPTDAKMRLDFFDDRQSKSDDPFILPDDSTRSYYESRRIDEVSHQSYVYRIRAIE